MKRFWSQERGLFVNNLPWLAEEKLPPLRPFAGHGDPLRSVPGRPEPAALRMLADCPPEMGFSYPCNAGWRLWALARGGRADVIVKDFRERWATMDSVKLNNTLQEDWIAQPDTQQQWSHCAVVPLYIAIHGLAGIRPLAPGFARAELRPQLADLPDLELTAHTASGPLRFAAHGTMGRRELTVEPPPRCQAELSCAVKRPWTCREPPETFPRTMSVTPCRRSRPP